MTVAAPKDPVRSAVRDWLDRYLAPGDAVVVTCSGGADSLALSLAASDEVADRPLFAATVDHGLQAGSAERAAQTAQTLRSIGYPDPQILVAEVAGPGGMEAAARRARYAVLADFASTVTPPGRRCAVLVAHTADDQAETVLLGLARGSGPRSIAGMRPWRPPWGRPLLGVSRVQTVATCAAAGLTPWQDPHNRDPAFTRVRIRREVLPLLDDVLGGGARDALGRTATLLARDLDALDEIAEGITAHVCHLDGTLDRAALARQPEAVVGRVLRSWAAAGGVGALTFEHLTRMTRQVMGPSGPPQVRVPGGFDVVRDGDRLRLVRIPGADEAPAGR